MDDGRFSSPSKCPDHLSTISFLSVISFVPSALSMGEVPTAGGPYRILRGSNECFISCQSA